MIENCKIAVVGGAGFLGSHLVNHLIDDRGCSVTVVDNLVTGRREFIHPKADFVHHDITKSEQRLKHIFDGHQYVFNYAAMPYIPVSFARPLHVFEINATGAIQVINAAQEAGCKGILQVSSAEIYGGVVGAPPDGIAPFGNERKIDEQEFVIPHSTYGAAKVAVDYYCQTAWRERRTPVIALRQFNCVGERETHPYIVPEIIGQLAKQFRDTPFKECPRCAAKPGMPRLCDSCLKRRTECHKTSSVPGVVKLGNNSFRDFLYAGDAVRAAVRLLENGAYGEVYNLGSETGVKMYDLAVRIGKLMGFESVEVQQDSARVRPWEIWHLQSDNTKIINDIGENVVNTPLNVALKKTIDWYTSNGSKWPWE